MNGYQTHLSDRYVSNEWIHSFIFKIFCKIVTWFQVVHFKQKNTFFHWIKKNYVPNLTYLSLSPSPSLSYISFCPTLSVSLSLIYLSLSYSLSYFSLSVSLYLPHSHISLCLSLSLFFISQRKLFFIELKINYVPILNGVNVKKHSISKAIISTKHYAIWKTSK